MTIELALRAGAGDDTFGRLSRAAYVPRAHLDATVAPARNRLRVTGAEALAAQDSWDTA